MATTTAAHTQTARPATRPVMDVTTTTLLADLDLAVAVAETHRAEALTLRAKVQRALMLPPTATAADIKAALA